MDFLHMFDYLQEYNRADSDPQRRALIKEKTNKYLAYAEAIYTNHLSNADHSLLREAAGAARARGALPLAMLRRSRDELAHYRVLAVLGPAVMLVLHRHQHACYAMKVIQKIPNNLTEFDNYFQQRSNETRQPILPTDIPYMVPLHAYVETDHLFFLILAYAPGERLFDYIKNYAKSVPNTPARELNLENVFAEPKKSKIDIQNDNQSIDVTDANVNIEAKIATKLANSGNKINSKPKIDILDDNVNVEPELSSSKYKIDSDAPENRVDCRVKIDVSGDINENVGRTDSLDSIEVSQLVMNSQKLLLNVDRALTDVPKICRMEEDSNAQGVEEEKGGAIDRRAESDERVETPSYAKAGGARRRDVLPPSSVRLWGAQILTALESLHNAGVIWRDLNPSNILLGARGQVILTYAVSYAGRGVFAARRAARALVAPELRRAGPEPADAALDRACDFWSFGAIMYELLCGYPLSAAHPHAWSRSALQLPDGLPLEARSLLTQLLAYEPSERLGGGAGGVADIKQHPYFRHIQWQHVYDAWVAPD